MREVALSDRERTLAAFPELQAVAPQLDVYERLLRRWQARINLVGPATLPSLWWRHFADSVQLGPPPDYCEKWVDLGSGAGFPGLVLALIARTGSPVSPTFTLVESDSRKAAFLREVSRETQADVEVVAIRGEVYISRSNAPDIVSSRAMTNLPELLTLVRPWLAGGTRGRFLIGVEQHKALAKVAVENILLSSKPSRIGNGFVLEASMRPKDL